MASTMEAATGGAVATNAGRNARQFQALFEVIPFTFTFDEDSMAAGVTAHRDITVTGAALGDFVLVAPRFDIASVGFFAWVQAANTVTVAALNLETTDANTVLNAAATYNGLILKPRVEWARN